MDVIQAMLVFVLIWVLVNPPNPRGRKTDKRIIYLLYDIRETLERIEFNSRPAAKAVAFKFETFKIKNGQEIRSDDMKLALGENAKVTVTGIVDAAGNPAKVEGDKLSWAVTGAQDIGDLQVADDGQSAVFVRNGKVGVCAVQVSGDADLGEGEKLIIGEVELDCAAGEAAKFELSVEAVPAV